MITVAQYSRKSTLDARGALARALARMISNLRFEGPQAQQFAEVYDDWPSFNESQVLPAAVVLPGDFRYAEDGTTPHLLEETWEPPQQSGLGLYRTAELEQDFTLLVRTNLIGERTILMHAIEDAFQTPDLLMGQRGARYGRFLPLPEYYGLLGRFALLGGAVIDSEDAAMREKRDASFSISARVPKVQVGPVWPLALTITKTLLTGSGQTISTETINAS